MAGVEELSTSSGQKANCRMSMLILVFQLDVAPFLRQLWCQVTEHTAHLQAWQLQVPAGATWPLSFKWPTCFLFRSIHILLNLLFASFAFFHSVQAACHCLDIARIETGDRAAECNNSVRQLRHRWGVCVQSVCLCVCVRHVGTNHKRENGHERGRGLYGLIEAPGAEN